MFFLIFKKFLNHDSCIFLRWNSFLDDLSNSINFSLVNEYYSPLLEESVYHFDFYRVDEEEEAMDMGVEDYFYSDSYCLVEWPEKIPNLLPESYVTVRIEQQAEERIYTIQ